MVKDEAAAHDTEQVVIAWLYEHPEFFNSHPELLETLLIPHPCKPAVSLLEHQNRLLREHSQRLHDRLVEWAAIARANDRLAERVQRLALSLLEARGGLDALLHGVKAMLRDEFKADGIALCLAGPPTTGLSAVEEFLRPDVIRLFDTVFQKGQPQCGPLSQDQIAALFGERTPGVASAALIPLSGERWRGLLAVGSCDQARFYPGVGTLFLEQIGALVSQALQTRLLAAGQRALADPPSARGNR